MTLPYKRGMQQGLNAEEVSARIRAARLLRGVSQRELAARLAERGLSARAAGALERGEIELRVAHRAALAEALNLSERWFVVPVDELCPDAPPLTIQRQLTDIDRKLSAALRRLLD